MHTHHTRLGRLCPALVATALLAAACGDEPAGPTSTPDYDLVGGEEVGQVFVVTNTSDVGPGSLRQAIEDANAAIGLDGISFSIPGPGPHTIQPGSPLPPVVDPVVIDGYSQGGAIANSSPTTSGSNAVLQIELDGSVSGGPGLLLLADGSAVRGLAIHRFQDGIVVVGGGSRIQGNHIGTDVTGSWAAPNLGNGILVLGADNLVGGVEPATRNVISGNLGDGVRIAGPAAVRNQIAGSYVGLAADGTSAIPNNLPEPDPTNGAGIHIIGGASDNLVGGPGAMPASCTGPCNVLSGNHRSGAWIEGQAHHNTVEGNVIGTDATGYLPIPNNRFGVFVGMLSSPGFDNRVVSNRIQWNGRDGVGIYAGSARNLVGGIGTTPGQCDGPCNLIAYNGQRFDTGGDGVRVYANAGGSNSVLGNAIFGQPHGEGIDVGNPGHTFNDPGDFDPFQNYPELLSAEVTPGRAVVSGHIDTQDPASVLIELFANPVPDPGGDPSGFGEGAVFLGRAAPDGEGDFTVRLDAVEPGTLISATATDSEGNTSEFAANIEAFPSRGPDSEGHPQFMPFSFTYYGCSEVVRLSGSFRFESSSTQVAPNRYLYSYRINAVGIGVGQSTGSLYNWNDVINEQGSFTGPQQTYTSLWRFRLIGRGDADDLLISGSYHVTVTPDGIVNFTMNDYSAECR